MEKRISGREIIILISCFIGSRVVIGLCGISFGYKAIFEYWQYLDVFSLEHNLLNSVWYQHSQPPVFNLLLGAVLKMHGDSRMIFHGLWMLVSLLNACLLVDISKKFSRAKWLPLALGLFYLLSPATMLFENELFYTSFISLLLLLSVYTVMAFREKPGWWSSAAICCFLSTLCLTRSMFHLLWLVVVYAILVVSWRNRQGLGKLIAGGLFSIVLVGGWYLKNFILFHNFSASSWVGINFSRIVFHDAPLQDSSNIASVHPFLPIAYYERFLPAGYTKKFEGWNDRVLLQEYKNGSFINMNQAGYLEVSKKYMASSLAYVRSHPGAYAGNAIKSFIIFFSPASSYFQLQENDYRIRYYDLFYSFNLSHLFEQKPMKKVALVVAAIPMFLAYCLVVGSLIAVAFKQGRMSGENLFIIFTIIFVLAVGTLFEYGENMRFRYELQPLFLILVAQVIEKWRQKRKAPLQS